jgi:hypothetical protein
VSLFPPNNVTAATTTATSVREHEHRQSRPWTAPGPWAPPSRTGTTGEHHRVRNKRHGRHPEPLETRHDALPKSPYKSSNDNDNERNKTQCNSAVSNTIGRIVHVTHSAYMWLTRSTTHTKSIRQKHSETNNSHINAHTFKSYMYIPDWWPNSFSWCRRTIPHTRPCAGSTPTVHFPDNACLGLVPFRAPCLRHPTRRR